MMDILKIALLVLLPLAAPAQESASVPVTFAKDVASIVFTQCAPCHRPGEVAPFSLLEYGDVKKRAKQVLDVVESRRMPPWKPIEGHGEFIGERRVKPEEMATLKKWVEQGCAEGDAKDLPALPKFPEGWAFGEPDLILTMTEAYTVPAEGKDILRAFVIPSGLTENKYVRAAQYRASNSRVVHHALIYADATKDSRQKDVADPAPGFEGWKIGPGAMLNAVGKWNPGGISQPYPDGMGKEILKKSDLVLQIHFSAIGKPVEEKSQIGLWFTKEVPKRTVMPLPLLNFKIDLPPGEKDLLVKDKIVIPVDVDLIGIIPHAHHLARECRISAKTPEGKELSLLYIKDWDFDWQEQYRYKDLIRLTKGTEVSMVWTFDNTSGNPRNPFNPPKRVKYGQRSEDEMAIVRLWLAPINATDKMTLYMSLLSKPQEK